MQRLPVAVLLLAALLLPCCWAYRGGTRNESCYNHRITHEESDPDPIPCGEDCAFSLNLIGEYDYLNMELIDENVTMLQCGKVYQLTFSTEYLAGYLVQARKGGTTFEPTSNIVGTWIDDPSDPPMYRILQCGRNSSSQSPVFDNSVTQTDLIEEKSIDFYWKAPTCLESDTFNVTFFFSVVPNLHTAFQPVPFGPWTVECTFPEYTVLEATNSPTDQPVNDNLQPEQAIKDVKSNQTGDDIPSDITEVFDDGSGDVGDFPARGLSPTPPRNFTLRPISSTALVASWARPRKHGIITHYEVFCRTAEGSLLNFTTGFERGRFQKQLTGRLLLTGLTVHTIYICSVLAVGFEGGDGEMSERLIARTDDRRPSVPRNFVMEALPGSSTLWVATWMEPFHPNGEILGYTIRCRNFITYFSFSPRELLGVVTLGADRFYWCSIHATNGAGNGSFSEELVLYTGHQLLPNNVRNLRAEAESRSIILTWDAPYLPQGQILRYDIGIFNKMELRNFTSEGYGLSYTATGLLPFTNYTIEVAAVNKHGRSFHNARHSAQTHEDAPSRPQSLLLNNATATSILFMWNFPSHPNGVIRSYHISYSLADNASDVTEIDTRSLAQHYRVTGLRPFTQYVLRVAGFTVALGEYSDSLRVTTQEIAPSAPRNVSATARTSSTILVSWERPSMENGNIREFVINYFPITDAFATTEISTFPRSNNYLITGLTPFTFYIISVAALTIALGEPSLSLRARTLEDVPSAPRNFRIRASRPSTTLFAAWMRPDITNGIISGYKVSCHSSSGSLYQYTFDSSRTEVTLRNLTAYTVYNCTVVATTGAGDGNLSALQIVRTREDRPSAPRNFILRTPISSSGLLLAEWMAPEFLNGEIRFYDCHCNGGGGFSRHVRTLEGNMTHYTTTFGVFSDTEYNCRIRAVNSLLGLYSAPAVGRSNQYTPTEPRNLTAVTGQTSIRLTWIPPRIIPQPIRGYLLQIFSDSGLSVNTTRSNLVFNATQLSPFTNYTFQVIAVSETGRGLSATLTVRTDEAAPSYPVQLGHINTTKSTIFFEMIPPAVLNGILRYYEVEYFDLSNASDRHIVTVEPTATHYLITGLKPWTDYNLLVAAFTVALSMYQTISVRTQESYPTPPVDLSATNITNSSMRVMWNAPVTPNGRISAYTITYFPVANPSDVAELTTTINHINLQPPQEVNITDLTPFTIYSVSVAATTIVQGESSSELIVMTEEGVPSAPRSFTLISDSANTLSASWMIPHPVYGVISHYTISCQSPAGSFQHSINGSETSTLLSNLSGYTVYSCSVLAATSIGEGKSSEHQTARTGQDKPLAPRNFVMFCLKSYQPNQIAGGWFVPPYVNGTIDHYLVTCNDNVTVYVESSGNQTTTFLNVSEGILYTCTVRAHNAVGYGPPSLPSSARLRQYAPGKPRNLTAATSSRSIQLTWEIPRISHGVITYYVIKLFSNGRRIINVRTAGHQLPYPVIDLVYAFNLRNATYTARRLTPFTEYRVEVLAQVGNKWYGEAARLTVVTNEEAPTYPQILFTNASDSYIFFTWLPPISLNGIIRYYQVTYFPSNDTSNAMEIQVEYFEMSNQTGTFILGLTPWTVYTFVIAAFTIELGPSDQRSIRTQETTPSAPVNLTAIHIGDDNIHIRWESPTMPNGDLHGYVITYFPTANASNITQFNIPLQRYYEIINLVPFTNFSITVAAVTIAPGEPTTIITQTDEREPLMPRNFMLEPIPDSPNSLLSSWLAPYPVYAFIRGYNIDCSGPPPSTVISYYFDASVTVGILQNLTAFTEYRCDIQAIGRGFLWSPPSKSLRATTAQDIPSEPQDFFVVAAFGSSDRLIASWMQPQFPNGIINLYRIVCNDLIFFSEVIDSVAYIHELQLSPDTEYLCTVHARNDAGYGFLSNISIGRTGQRNPGAPRNLIAVPGSESITMTWNPPRVMQGPIESYALSILSTSIQREFSIPGSNLSSITSNFTVTMLFPFTNYTIEFAAISGYGRGASVRLSVLTDEDAPSPTVILSANSTNSSVFITWLPPTMPNGIIRSYHLQYFPTLNFLTPISLSIEGSATSANISGLESSTNYTLQIEATTILAGNSSAIIVVRTQDNIPEKPWNLNAVTGLSFITVRWLAPLKTEEVIIRFELSMYSSISRNNFNITDLTFTATGLPPYTNYTFEVRAVTGAGRGPSESLTVYTDEDAPASPLMLEFNNITKTSVYVTWEAPSRPNGKIRYYQIEYYPSHNIFNYSIYAVEARTLFFNITGLIPWTEYFVKIAAFTIVLGEYTAIETVSTLESEPLAPRNFTLATIPKSPTTLSASWQIPFYTFGNISSYTVNCSSPSGSLYYFISHSETVTILDGLAPYTEYTCMVTATNQVGTGPPSQTSVARTDEGVPSPPRDFEVAVRIESSFVVDATYTPPLYSNGVLLDYRVDCVALDGRHTFEDDIAPPTPIRLLDRTTHTCTARARTRRGYGEPSDEVRVIAGQHFPTEPTNLSVTHFNATSATITWGRPLITSGAIQGYIIRSHNFLLGSKNIDATIMNYTFVGLIPFTNYTISVAAMNNFFTGQYANVTVLTLESAPSAPRNVTARPLSSTSIIVTWNKPGMPNGIIRRYNVHYYQSDVGRSNLTSTFSPWTNITLQNLRIYRSYTILVEAVTIAVGNQSTVIAITLEDTPSIPTNVSIFISSTYVYLTWMAPEMPNGRIRYQIVRFRERISDQDEYTFRLNASARSFNFTEAKPYTPYFMYIVAATIQTGRRYIRVFTTLESTPSAPRDVRAQSTSSTTIQVTWTKPRVLNGFIRFYNISYYRRNVGLSDVKQVSINATTVQLSGLDIYTRYSIYVEAVTVGVGNQSNIVTVRTDEGAPSALRNVTVALHSNFSVLISWEPPAHPNGMIINYFASTNSDSTIGSYRHAFVKYPQQSLIFYGLHGFINYTFSVYAITQRFRGEFTNVTIMIPESIPSRPRSFRVARIHDSNSTLRASWRMPERPNGIITGYTVTCMLSSQIKQYNFNSSVMSAILTDLAVYTIYACTVAAHTRLGHGNSSTLSRARTDEGIPTAPRNLIVTGLRDFSNRLFATWDEPYPVNGVIDFYYANYTLPPNKNLKSYSQSTTFFLYHLTPGSEISFAVRAHSRVGYGPYSETVIMRVGQYLPDEPRNLTAKADSTFITVSWQPPRIPSGAIIRYEVSIFNNSDQNSYIVSSFNLTFTITGLSPFTNYTISIAAVIMLGRGESANLSVSTEEDAPTQPTILFGAATTSTDTTITFSWLPPARPNGIVRHYQVTYSPRLKPTNVIVINTTETRITITNLSPLTTYSLQVAAFTIRLGPPNGVFATTLRRRPGPPRNLIAIEINSTLITVAWQPSIVTKGTLIRYEISVIGHLNTHVEATVLRYTATGLRPFTNYIFEVAGVSEHGRGRSARIAVLTGETAPSAPRNVRVQSTSSTTILVTWTEPSRVQGIIRYYNVSYYRSSVGVSDLQQVTVNSTAVELSGLDKFTFYSIFVEAATLHVGDQSNVVTVRTDADVPSPPRNVTAVLFSNFSVFVSWEPPASPNGILVNYLAVANTNPPEQNPPSIFTGPTQHSGMISGLHGFTNYTLSVAAVLIPFILGENANVTIMTPESIPSRPRPFIVTLISGSNNTLHASWREPEHPNGIITGYSISCASSSEVKHYNFNGSVMSAILGDLAVYTVYSCTIAAHNRIGQGDSSPISRASTGEGITTAPRNLLVTGLHGFPDQLLATWDEPDPVNGLIRFYFANYTLPPNINRKSSSRTRMKLLDNLSPGSEISFRVRAFTRLGYGPYSETVIGRVGQYLPDEPRNLTAEANSTSITVTWQPPRIPSGAISYEVSVFNSSNQRNFNVSASYLTFRIVELSPFTNYTLEIAAANAMGRGERASLIVQTAESAPSHPRLHSGFERSTNTSIYILWEPPSMPNGIIRFYQVTYFSRNDQTSVTLINTTETHINVTGLRPLTLYTLQVAAFTVELGPFSGVVVMTRQAVPRVPRNLAAQVIEATFIEVTWEPSIITQGTLIRYELYLSSTSGQREFTVEISESLSFTATDLFPFTNYTFEVAGVSGYGRGPSASLTVRTAESAPTNPVLNFGNTTETSIYLAWTTPTRPNGIIRRYVIQYLEHSNISTMTDVSTESTSLNYTLSGLSPWTYYIVSVAAFTVTLGQFSNQLRLQTQESTPSPPSDVSGTSRSYSTIQVEWTPPALPNGVIRGYQITYYPTHNSSDVTRVSVASSPWHFEIMGLTAFTEYSLVLAAITIGIGMPSPLIIVRTQEGASGAPTLYFGNTTKSSLYLAWTVPVMPNGIIRNYQLVYYPSDNVSRSIEVSIDSSELDFNITNLRPWTYFSAKVAAVTIVQGQYSNVLQLRTQPSTPSAPRNVFARSTDSSTILVVWEPPAIPNGIIGDYLVSYFPINNDSDITTVSAAPSALQYFITGLTAFTTYSISVVAFTIASGDPSPSIVVMTQEGIPGRVSDLVAIPRGPTAITVTWEPPRILGGEIVRYELSVFSRSGQRDYNIAGHSLHFTLSQLSAFTNYTIEVAAVTRSGRGQNARVTVRTNEDAPEPPVLYFVNSTATSLYLLWAAPTMPNGIIRNYQIAYGLHNSSMMTEIIGPSPLSYTITDLKPASLYDVRVAAVTVRRGQYSIVFSQYTKESTPGVVTDLRINVLNSSALIVSFSTPTSPNGVITGYNVYYVPFVNGTITGNAFSIVISPRKDGQYSKTLRKLAAFTTYRVRVAAVTEIGEGEAEQRFASINPGASSPPTDVNRTAITTNSITISWGSPRNPRGIIRGYVVRYYPSMKLDDAREENITLPRKLQFEIPRLMPYTLYTITVRAYSFGSDPFVVHQGEESNPIIIRTQEPYPDPPGNFTLSTVAGSPHQLQAYWIFSNPHALITHFLVDCNSTPHYLFDAPADKVAQVRLTNLQPFTVYSCSVFASSSRFVSFASVLSVARTDEGVPPAPRNFQLEMVVNTSTLTASWSEPVPMNGIIQAYTINCSTATSPTPILFYLSASERNTTLTNLDPFTDYTCSISASTGAGPGNSTNLISARTGGESKTLMRSTTSLLLHGSQGAQSSGSLKNLLFPELFVISSILACFFTQANF